MTMAILLQINLIFMLDTEASLWRLKHGSLCIIEDIVVDEWSDDMGLPHRGII